MICVLCRCQAALLISVQIQIQIKSAGNCQIIMLPCPAQYKCLTMGKANRLCNNASLVQIIQSNEKKKRKKHDHGLIQQLAKILL